VLNKKKVVFEKKNFKTTCTKDAIDGGIDEEEVFLPPDSETLGGVAEW